MVGCVRTAWKSFLRNQVEEVVSIDLFVVPTIAFRQLWPTVREALRESHADQKHEHEVAVERLKTEYDRLEKRIQAMYVDKLDGRVDSVFFGRMSVEWRAEQDRCLTEISGHQSAEQSYFEEGVRILELARNARRLFEKQEPREKRRLLQFVVSKLHLEGGAAHGGTTPIL
jgi:site-specific DNA recombinase